MTIHLLQIGRPVIKGAWWHLTGRSGLPKRYFFILPRTAYLVEIVRQGPWGPSELDTPGLGCGDAFGLALLDCCSFVFCDKRQNLQYDIAQERSHQILAPAGIQKGHVQYHDVNALLFRQNAPLTLDIFIISAETVDALDVEQIVLF